MYAIFPRTKDGVTILSLQETDGKAKWMTTQTFAVKNRDTQAMEFAK
jgi:hypothetical protein